ncbi:MAG: ATP-binding cassette domain-containing protein [Paludibacter sp.]|nr:ATP-binding cassette domain-containing protein [Paludibacter sp.]
MVEFQNISIKQGAFSLNNISVKLADDTYYCLLGKTGSGKTTLVEMLCGLRKFNSGTLLINGIDASESKPGERDIGYVPQDLILFNQMTVSDNIGFALKIRKVDKIIRDQRIKEVSEMLGISHLLQRLPRNLSGGEKQRVAIGRAIIFQPAILLLDEPFNALDYVTKQELFKMLKSIKSKMKVTVLHVTHNIDEVENLAEIVLTIENAKIEMQIRNDFFETRNILFSEEVI